MRAYTPPSFKIEVDGFWRKLGPGSKGRDADGNPVDGRTWVKGHLRWRGRPDRQSVIFVKSSVAAAKAKAAAILAGDPNAKVIGDQLPPGLPQDPADAGTDTGWLYVMRCPLMDNDVYKVGWSSREPKVRADELSAATGVPLAYIVVESWAVQHARAIEAETHLALAGCRVNPRREFFKAPFETLRAQIAAVLSRAAA